MRKDVGAGFQTRPNRAKEIPGAPEDAPLQVNMIKEQIP